MKLLLSIFLSALSFSGFAQLFQGTLKLGTADNKAVIVIKPNQNLQSRPTNFQFTLAVPVSVGTRPVLSIESNDYAANFGQVDIIQTATFGTDYIYLINMAIVQAPEVSYTSDVEDTVMHVAFTGNVTSTTDVRMVQLPDGLATLGAGGENGNYNFFIEFLGTERTNTTNMFYATNGALVVNNPLGYAGYSSVQRGGVIVPITWLDFTALRSGNDAVLTWKVTNQVDNDHYEVEVSKDGSVFTLLARVNEAGSNEYRYTHENITRMSAPSLFYRIKQVDKDGKFSYSIVRRVQVDAKPLSITLQENPVKGSSVKAFIHASNNGKGKLIITDLSGKVIYQKQAVWNAGTTTENIDLSNQASGSYIISLISDGERLQLKFVK